MTADNDLLRRYVAERSEPAFAELVRRHVNLVYATALRETGGDRHLAEDVVQAVFLELARKAGALRSHPTLAGWLYQCVRWVSANARRAETRRQRREEEAQAMQASDRTDPVESTWEQIRPLIDDAMHDLSEPDRLAVVLRYFQDRSLREVGEVLGLSENSARMRVERALEKLRIVLQRRGVTSTTTGLGAALSVGALVIAPPALAATVTHAAITGAATAGTSAFTTFQLMTITKTQIALIGTLLVAGVATPLWQQQRLQRAQGEITRLQESNARLPQLEAELAKLAKVQVDAKELARLREEGEKNKLEVAKLRNMAGAARRAETEMPQMRTELARKRSEEKADGGDSPMGNLMQEVMSQQTKGQVTRMQAKLKLNPGQVEAVQGILERQAKVASQAVQKVFSGKAGGEEMANLQKESGSGKDDINALLTPEQQALYKEFQRDEAVGQARLVANAEMMQINGTLGLSTEQQDQVFSALYDQNLNQMLAQTDAAKLGGSPAATMETIMESKIKALENVLSADQLQAYRKQQETQLQFIKNFLPKAATGAK